MIDSSTIVEFYPLFLQGIVISMQIALFGCILGITIGTLLGILLSTGSRILRFLIMIYVTIIRGTPMLIQIAATFYLLKFAGYGISAFWSAILSIGLNSGAYVSQIILSGIQSVSKGQIEAAKTLGFSQWQTIQLIVLPQAIRNVMPALGNEFVTLVKDSSLASTIGVYELTKQGEIIMSQTFDAPTVYMMLGLIYLVLTSVVSFLVGQIDKKMQYHVKH